MAKKSSVTCPLCGDKHAPDGPQHPNHLSKTDGSLCPMSARTIQGHEDDGPVTGGASPVGGDTATPGGPAGTTTTP